MGKLQSIQISSFVKGLNASASKTNQPPNTFPRSSNLLLTRRGSLITVDGSQIVHAFNGVPTANRGRILAAYLYQPTGVPSYYMMLASAPDLPLGAPLNLSVATAAGGTLPAATYFYKVTTLDGIGGESTASLEASVITGANGQNTLTWNTVPNASGYNVYRSIGSGGEGLLGGVGLPVPQLIPGNATITFVDNGSVAPVGAVYNILAAPNGVTGRSAPPSHGHGGFGTWNFFVTVNVPVVTGIFIVAGCSVGNGIYGPPTWATSGQGSIIAASTIGGTGGVPNGTNIGGGGTISFVTTPPTSDTTQQIVLFKMPVIPAPVATLPISYNNSNIVALFPAGLKTASSPASGGGGTGGGGSSGGGGTGGGSGGGTGGGGGRGPFLP